MSAFSATDPMTLAARAVTCYGSGVRLARYVEELSRRGFNFFDKHTRPRAEEVMRREAADFDRHYERNLRPRRQLGRECYN